MIKGTDLVEGVKITDPSPSNLSSSSFSKLRKEHIQETSREHVQCVLYAEMIKETRFSPSTNL